jgi:hypothetical protein
MTRSVILTENPPNIVKIRIIREPEIYLLFSPEECTFSVYPSKVGGVLRQERPA